MLICKWCGKEFERTNNRGPIPKYCKQSHRQRAYEKRRWKEWAMSDLAGGGNRMSATKTKKCSRCGEEKPLAFFYRDRRLKDGRMARCRRCFLEVQNQK